VLAGRVVRAGGLGAGAHWGREVGGELGGEDCGAGGGDEVFVGEGGEEGVFEAWFGESLGILYDMRREEVVLTANFRPITNYDQRIPQVTSFAYVNCQNRPMHGIGNSI
jgi:hypothetical protein